MEAFMGQYLQWIVLGLVVVCVGMAIWTAVRISRMERRLRRTFGLWQRQLTDDAQNVQLRLSEQRDTVHGSLRDIQDSVLSMLGEISRTQQLQLDSFGSQLRSVQRSEEERLERLGAGITAKLGDYERQMVQMRVTLDEGMRRMQDGNAKKLDEIRVTVGEKLDSTLDKRLNDSFKLVSERLEQVYKGLGEMHSLAEGVGDLKKVLTNVKTRGTWGEVQLGALLEQMLAPGQYEANVQIKPGSAERVEYAVCMPGRQKDARVLLPIDAKFPLADYRRLTDASEAGDAQGVEEAGRALEVALRTEAKRIQTKYLDPPNTTDFAMMYLPVEGLYAEALRRGGLAERMQQDFRVVIAGPTTLMALLNSLQMGFRTLAIEQRSSEVWALLGAVKTEFGRFADILIRTQKRLRLASDSIEDATRKTQAIQRKLSDVQQLPEQESAAFLEDLPQLAELTGAEDAEDAQEDEMLL